MYDCFVLCVDRHSGWMVAVPELYKGLSGAKVAQKMLQHLWRPFGIPSIMTSDHGAQFANAWWQEMCAHFGVEHAFSHAYEHQANGRAEMGGQQVMEKLRKLHADEGTNWVEALPHAVDLIHDTPGVAGLSPSEIVFGRQRPLAHLPYEPPNECQDAEEFFSRMEKIRRKVAEALNLEHHKEANRLNVLRRALIPLAPGAKVWYKRPERTGDKTASRWLGPGIVLSREGEGSYTVKIGEDKEIAAPRHFLKEYVEDRFNENPKPLYFHRRLVADPEMAMDEWLVDKVVRHRRKPDGRWEFLTLWEGCAPSEATWEPTNHFFHRYAAPLIKYITEKNLPVDIAQELRTNPMTEG